MLGVLLLLLAMLAPVAAHAAGSPTGAVAAAWPATWNNYLLASGDIIGDNNTDQNPSTLDLASGPCAGNCVGPDSSVLYYSDGTTAFFRMRLATDLTDNSKGGLVGGAFLVQLADASDNVLAVVGVDGKSSSVDYVYVADAPGNNVTPIYTYPFDNSGSETSGGMRMLSAGDGSGQYFLDFQVPVATITTVSGGAITTSTPIKMYYGSSAAANLATINKDFMLGDVSSADFSGIAIVTLTPASLTLSSGAVSATGPNPPAETATSTYTVTLTASNPGGSQLTSTTVTVPIPSGATASSLSTAAGTFTGGGTSELTWTIGTIPAGGFVEATFTVSVTPGTSTAGSTITLVSLQSGSGSDVPAAATRTATAAAITVGPVAVAPNWTVDFDSQGGSAVSSQSVASNGNASTPTPPTLTGYTLDGWYTAASGGSLWTFATDTVTADTTLYAHWTAIDYTVSFDSQGGSAISSQTVAYDAYAAIPVSPPTLTGYTFAGWFDAASGGSGWDFPGTAITGDTTIYAQWTAIDYTVTFDSQGGSAISSQTVAYDAYAAIPVSPPTLTGYTFAGWFDAASGGSAWNFGADAITGDTTIYAQWTAIDYTVTFDSQGGSAISSEMVAYGNYATLPASPPTRAGFSFDGWFTLDSGGSTWNFPGTAITGDTTIYAHWTPLGYTVTFDSQGGSAVGALTVANGEYAAEPSPPTYAGHTFNGWFSAASGGTEWDFGTDAVTGDVTLYAQWTTLNYPVTFDSHGGSSVATENVPYGDYATEPADPTRYGYDFDGWFTAESGGTAWDFGANAITAATTIHAQWTLADFTVSYDSQGGSAVGSETVTFGNYAAEPLDPALTGYTFLGWYTLASGGTAWDFGATAITGDLTLYAHWAPIDYAVTFDTQGGSAVAGATVAYGETVPSPSAPTLSGYAFDGWFTAASGGTEWDFLADTITGDTTIYAHWTPIDYTLTFDSQGGSAVVGQVVAFGDLGTEPTDPTKYGTTFDGWYTSASGGTLWDFDADVVASATTLYAYWTPVNYPVTFDSQGGNAVGGQSVAYGGYASEPSDPTQSGYTFDGWFTSASGGTLWDFGTDAIAGATTLYAQWTPVDYTATFDSQGGTAVGSQTLPYGSLVAQPTPPTQFGYTLDGWYTAASGGTLWDFSADTMTGDITLYAQWIANTNTVTFDGQGGSFTAGETVATGNLVTEPADPTRYGYTLDGWYDASTGGSLWDFGADTVPGDMILYAQWTIVNYPVTFDSQGGNAVGGQSVAYGDYASEPSDPAFAGYTFDGWYTAASGGALWDFGADAITAATTLYAQWTPVDYTATFDSQGGTAVSSQTLPNGSLVTQPAPPPRAGYAFDGWFDASSGGSAWDFGSDTLTGNVTLYAQWSAIPYTLAFDSQGGTPVTAQTVPYDTLATEPTDPTRGGYTFDGWYTLSSGGVVWDFTTDTVVADATVYAQWTPVDYTLTYDSQGGDAVSSETVAYGALATEPVDPTRTGYTFDGWSTAVSGGSAWNFATNTMTGDRTLYAAWTPASYTVTFDTQGGSSVPDETVDYNEFATEPSAPTRTGYAFDGWFDSASGGTAWDFDATTITDDTTIYAQWTILTNVVSFDSQGGGTVPNQTIDYDDTATEPTEPTKSGYTFEGWFSAPTAGTEWDFTTDTVVTSLTLYGQWTIVTYTVSYDSQGGSAVASESVNYGGLATEPTDPTRTGYTFDDWYSASSGGFVWDFTSNTITADKTLYAAWTPIDYSVTFDTQGGTVVSGQTVSYNTFAATPATPTRTGYTFDGWFDAASGGSEWDFGTDAITDDTTIYAQWTIITNPVTFDSQGGSGVSSQTIDYDGLVVEPVDPTFTGFTFDGWFDAASGGTAWDFGADTVTSPETLYAQWTAITYNVTYDSQGGSAVSSETVGYNALVTEPADPTLTGYTFDGWFDASSAGAPWDFPSDSVLADTTLYAQWTAIDYTVSYSSQGGSAVASETVAFNGMATEPSDPTRPGYTFLGWFDSASGGSVWDFTGTSVSGDMTLYAHWSAIDYTVTFDSQGGSAEAAQTVNYDDLVAEPSDATLSGYTFLGWFDAASGGTLWDFAADGVTGDVTLYAHWALLVNVSFVNGADTIPSQLVIVGGYAVPPSTPVRDGYTFLGWFTDPTGGDEWDFAVDPATGDIVLHAHWERDTLAATGAPVDRQVTWALGLLLGGFLLLMLGRWRRTRLLGMNDPA